MSEGTLKKMVIVLAVLVLAWVVATITGGDPPDPGEAGGEMAEFLEALTPDAATTLELTGGGADIAAVRLERDSEASGWRVEGHPADSALVARFLSALADVEAGAPVSVNPDNHARMAVDAAAARQVVIEGPAGPDTLLLGDPGRQAGTVYARLPGHDPVHLLTADLSTHARRPSGDWRSRLMARVDTAAIGLVEVERDGTSYRLERGDSTWTVGGDPAEALPLDYLMGSLASLSGGGFPGTAPEGEASRRVTVRTAEGEEVLLLRLFDPPADGTNFRALVSGPSAFQPDEPFLLAPFRADRLSPEPATIMGGEAGDG